VKSVVEDAERRDLIGGEERSAQERAELSTPACCSVPTPPQLLVRMVFTNGEGNHDSHLIYRRNALRKNTQFRKRHNFWSRTPSKP
jgi:hypothetical protein